MTANDAEPLYRLPDDLVVTADGPIRIVTLSRPDALNGATLVLHQALARGVDRHRRGCRGPGGDPDRQR